MGGAKRGHVMPLEWLVGTPKICLSRPPQRALWEAKGCSECIVDKAEVIGYFMFARHPDTIQRRCPR